MSHQDVFRQFWELVGQMQTCGGSGNHIPEKRNLVREEQRLGNGCSFGGTGQQKEEFLHVGVFRGRLQPGRSHEVHTDNRPVAAAASNSSRTVSHDSDFPEAHSQLGTSRQGLAKLLFPSVQMKVGSRLSVSARPCSLNARV